MSLLFAILVGILFAVGTYFLLKRSIVKLILGVIMLGYGTNLLIFMTGDLSGRDMPILGIGTAQKSDPIPQALILTAIVIGFGVLAFTMTLAYRFYFDIRTEDLDEMYQETDIQ